MAPVARAEEKPSPGSEEFQALKKQFEAAQSHFLDAQKQAIAVLQEAKTADDKKAAQKMLQELAADSPSPKFAPRFLELAEKLSSSQDPAAVEPALLAVRLSGGPRNKSGVFGKAVALLQKDFVTSPAIKPALRVLAANNDEAAEKLVRDVLARNPDRKVQAAACKALIAVHENNAQLAERIQSNDRFRTDYEKSVGKEHVEKLLAGLDKAKNETDELKKMLRDKFSDIFPDLSIGKMVPEVVIQDAAGKEAKLSALKGKVVVVDIWATWCGPCRAMIPHERDMVERLKDKPFALVSISADAKKETLTEFLAKEKMPWTHWWNGAEGGILEDWDVQYFPTIYVIDAKGTIRHKDLRGEQLEEAVNELLKEVGEKK
jgi:thiol-disulfide isomerase/thioredoxin